MNGNEDFKKADQLGRDKFEKILKEWGVTEYLFPRYSGAKNDVLWNSSPNTDKDASFVGEIKLRKGNLDKYPDHLLELSKYESLMVAFSLGFLPYYIVLFDDGYILFNMLKIKVEDMDIRPTKSSRTTVGADQSEYIRDAYYIPTKLGKVVYYE